MLQNKQQASENLKVSFKQYIGNPDYFGIQPNVYKNFLQTEQVNIMTDIDNDV